MMPAATAFPRIADPARLLAANAKARAMFDKSYQGASIGLKTVLHHRSVIRIFTRSFAVAMRNWHIATTVPRAAVGSTTVAAEAEAAMLKKVDETLAYFRGKLAEREARARLAAVDLSLIRHGEAFVEETRVVGPVAVRMHELMLVCDKFLDASAAFYAFGQIDGTAANLELLDVKRRLQGVIASIRNHRRSALERVREMKAPPAMVSSDPGLPL